MEKDRYEKLVKEFGEDKIKEMLERLDEYADINPKRFKQYSAHDVVIRKWLREDIAKTKIVDPGTFKGPNSSNEQFAKKVYDKFKHPDIELMKDAIMFVNRGAGSSLCISFKENGFREQVLNRLRKMNLPISDL